MDEFLVYAIIMAVVFLPDLLRKRKVKTKPRTQQKQRPAAKTESLPRTDKVRRWEEAPVLETKPKESSAKADQEAVSRQDSSDAEKEENKILAVYRKKLAEKRAAGISASAVEAAPKRPAKKKPLISVSANQALQGLMWAELLQPPLAKRNRENGRKGL